MKKNMQNKVVIFDCDGTLLDTYNLIIKCTRRTFDVVFPELNVSDQEIDAFFGPLLDDSFRKYTNDEERVQKAIQVYRQLIIDLHPEYVRAFPGIDELIKDLSGKGYKLAIVSNKVSETIILGLEINRLDQYFDLILGAEKLKNPKPDPDGIKQVCEYYKTTKVMFVGDTKIDIETGHNANSNQHEVKTIGVTWCNITREQFIDWKADYIVDQPNEIIPILEGFYEI